MSMIEVKNLTKQFAGRTVVHEVSFDVREGEIFGFLGKNGAGKSTTINMLTGIIRPTFGTVRILGTPLEKLDAVKSRLGVLPDNSNYFVDLSSYQHMKYFARLKGVPQTDKEIMEKLAIVGLSGHEHKKVGKYSLGMKKRLGIAQTLIGSPELIFLDEPTANLDPESTSDIQKLIVKLRESGKAIFITSHNLHEMEKICTRIAIMEQGKLTKIGTLEELRRQHNQAYQTLYLRTGVMGLEQQQQCLQKMTTMGFAVNSTPDGFTVHYQNEQDIPVLVRALIEENQDIYRVEVEKVSLEQIFLD